MRNLCVVIFLSAFCVNGILGHGVGKHVPAPAPARSRFSALSGGGLSWVPVDLMLHFDWPARSARFAGREILTIGPGTPFNVRVTSAWAYSWFASEGRYGMYYVHFQLRYKSFPFTRGWSASAGRYGSYYVHFLLRYKSFPFTRYQCSAWVHWPPPFPVHLDGLPQEEYNFCVPF